MSSPEHKQKIWNYVKDIKVGMLTTLDGEVLRSRPMHIVQDEYDGTLWFFTSASADKVTEVQQERAVAITFSDVKNDVFVSLSGTAKVSKDQKLIDKYWNAFVGAWFPEGKDSSDAALLEVKIHAGEHWDSTDSAVTQLFKVAAANITDKKPNMGENEKFSSATTPM